jgi:hypothetical protein
MRLAVKRDGRPGLVRLLGCESLADAVVDGTARLIDRYRSVRKPLRRAAARRAKGQPLKAA